jgi:RNA polymerase primary sigma factor/RNA polymerase sigma factor
MHSDYQSPILRQFRDQQVKYAPRDKQLQQADAAELLYWEIDPERAYPWEYLCDKLTRFRPDSNPKLTVSGDQVRHDLRLFVEDITEAAGIEVEAVGEPVMTVEELSERFNVSTKTISRWRSDGLMSRKISFDGRKRVVFLTSSVDRFTERQFAKIERGARFSQLTNEEKETIVLEARRLASTGGCPADVTRTLAEQMGRSVETIRYTLKQYDEANPHLAVFPDKTGPLSEMAREDICDAYKAGESVDALADRYCRTKTSIYRIVNEVRARRITELQLDFIDNELFHQSNAALEILGEMPENAMPRKTRRPSGDLPPYLAELYEHPLLTREQEAHLFRKMNFLKCRAAEFRRQLDPRRPKSGIMEQIEEDYDGAQDVKNRIIQANLRLVVSIAKRHVGPNEAFFELVSDGNMSLMRAVEKFDYSRGNKFSTYATWAIMKNFARSIPDDAKRRARFRTSQEEMFEAAIDIRTDPYEQEAAQFRRERDVSRILDRLDEREAQIIRSRFGLGNDREPQTLKEVGRILGVTKERVRQIEARALNKLKRAAQEERIDLPG